MEAHAVGIALYQVELAGLGGEAAGGVEAEQDGALGEEGGVLGVDVLGLLGEGAGVRALYEAACPGDDVALGVSDRDDEAVGKGGVGPEVALG